MKSVRNRIRSLAIYSGICGAVLRATLALGLVFCVLGDLSAGDGQIRFKSVVDGVERRSFKWQPPSGGMAVQIHAFRVDPRVHQFRVALAPSGTRDTVHSLARKNGLFLAVNASYFDENDKPLGLLIDKGVEKQGLRKVDWGVFSVDRSGKASIVHTRDYQGSPKISAAVQTGPRLVVAGKALKLKPQIARRTAVCVDGSGLVVFLIAEGGVFLQDLAELLRSSEGTGGLGCRDALNLDGGPSSQGTFVMGKDSWDVYGGTSVPVVLGVQVGKGEGKP